MKLVGRGSKRPLETGTWEISPAQLIPSIKTRRYFKTQVYVAVMLLSLLHIIMVMNPVLKKRFIDSIEYLRKMGFSEDCANLTSRTLKLQENLHED